MDKYWMRFWRWKYCSKEIHHWHYVYESFYDISKEPWRVCMACGVTEEKMKNLSCWVRVKPLF